MLQVIKQIARYLVMRSPEKGGHMSGETSHIAEEEVEMTSQAMIASIQDYEKVSILHIFFNLLYFALI